MLDPIGRVTALNLEASRYFGWTERELLGEPMGRLIPTRFHSLLGPDEATGNLFRAASTKSAPLSCFALRRNGTEFPVELTWRLLGGADTQMLVTVRDLTQWHRTRDARTRGNEQANATLEAIGDAVITTDAACVITYLNPVAEHLTGWTAQDAKGQSLDAVLSLIAESTREPVADTAARCLKEGRSIDLQEGVLLLRRDGTEVPVGDSAAPVRDRSGAIVGVVLVIQDESEKRRVGHKLSFEATHDPLTGLINRREFERRLTRVVTGLGGDASDHVLLCLDLDRFKVVNDTCGHDAGDDLLQKLGPLLARQLRKRDTLARLGGDEFGVLLENCPLYEGTRIAENVRAAVERYRFEWGGQTFTIGVSIGLIPVTAQSGGITSVLKAADAACYTAKEGGGNRVQLERLGRDPSLASPQAERRVSRLSRAVAEGQFQLYAQPIVALQPGLPPNPRFEVLLRLPDSKGSMQDAADFLPEAERYNLMQAIDRWVVAEAILQLGRWRRDNPDAPVPICSINLGTSALSDEGFVSALEQQLTTNSIAAESICFEISAAAALANLARTVRFLAAIRSTGCGMALEDFGSGVTSFTNLKALPVDFLKIGGHFVREVVDDPVYGSIVSAVNQIGRSMGISTIAKQVGSDRVLRKLRAMGVGYAQGRALTPPVPMTDWDQRVMTPSLRRSA